MSPVLRSNGLPQMMTRCSASCPVTAGGPRRPDALPGEFDCARVVAVADGSERDGVPDRWTAAGAAYGMWMDIALDPRFADGAGSTRIDTSDNVTQ
jgi:hypothetical protein